MRNGAMRNYTKTVFRKNHKQNPPEKFQEDFLLVTAKKSSADRTSFNIKLLHISHKRIL